MQYQINTGTDSRYELRSSERAILPAAWVAVLAANGAYNVKEVSKGAATVVYFDCGNPNHIRQAIRTILNTNNFNVRHRPRWQAKAARKAELAAQRTA